jgi:hypothetical protein
MKNNKQLTVVEWLEKQTRKPEWHSLKRGDIFEQAKEMHKKEMVMFVLNVMGKYRNGDVLAEVATELYEQTYGGGEQ